MRSSTTSSLLGLVSCVCVCSRVHLSFIHHPPTHPPTDAAGRQSNKQRPSLLARLDSSRVYVCVRVHAQRVSYSCCNSRATVVPLRVGPSNADRPTWPKPFRPHGRTRDVDALSLSLPIHCHHRLSVACGFESPRCGSRRCMRPRRTATILLIRRRYAAARTRNAHEMQLELGELIDELFDGDVSPAATSRSCSSAGLPLGAPCCTS